MLPAIAERQLRDSGFVNAELRCERLVREPAPCVKAADGLNLIGGQFMGPLLPPSDQRRVASIWVVCAAQNSRARPFSRTASLPPHVSDVVLAGPEEQVIRTNAGRVVAEMANPHLGGNRPKMQLPRNAMRVGNRVLRAVVERAVPRRVSPCSPLPALSVRIDLRPESRGDWDSARRSSRGPFSAHSFVVTRTKAHTKPSGAAIAIGKAKIGLNARLWGHLGLILRGVTGPGVTALRPLSIVPRRGM